MGFVSGICVVCTVLSRRQDDLFSNPNCIITEDYEDFQEHAESQRLIQSFALTWFALLQVACSLYPFSSDEISDDLVL